MKKAIFLFCLLCTCAMVSYAQAPTLDIPAKIDWDAPLSVIVPMLTDWYTWLYAAIVYLVTYLARYVPALNRIPNFAYIALMVAVCVGWAFIQIGADAKKLVIPFLMNLNLYKLVLQYVFGKRVPDAVFEPPMK
jgi:hypothetical protein